MRQSTRLILNTSVTYARMALTVGLGLLATRLTLSTLGSDGADDWFKLIAAVSFAFVLYEGISVAAERALAFEIGRAARADAALPSDTATRPVSVATVFSTTAAIFGAVAVLVLLLGFGLAAWIPGWYQVPQERATVAAASIPWLAGMIAAQILAAPFRVMFTAHQTMGVLTVADLADSLGKLGAIILAARWAGPAGSALELLAIFTCLAQCLSSGIVVVLCLTLYPDGRPSPRRFSSAALRELAHFTTWSVVGNISYRLRMSGPPLLLARAFTTGSPVNTAYGLGVTVAGYQLNLSGAINRAAAPAVISAWGRGDRARVADLVQLVNKYSTLLALFYLVPLEIEMPTVLRLWLPPEKIPEHAVPFVRLVMVQMALSWLYMGYHHAISAHGRIARYMLIAVTMEVLSLVAAWITLRLPGVPPWGMSITLSVMTLITCTVYVWHICRLMQLPFTDWFKRTWVPVGIVAAVATGAALVPMLVMTEGFVRLVVTTAVYGLAAVPCIWFVAMGHEERGHFRRLLGAGLHRLRGHSA